MNDIFPLLAIETTDELCSAALLLNQNEYSEINVRGKHVHSERLVPSIEQLLLSNRIQVGELKVVAVSEGPGSFTGLRIGMSAAKGIAVGAQIHVILVPTFEAIAFKYSNFLPDDSLFCIVKKASRDEVYFAKYKVKDNNYFLVQPLSLIQLDELPKLTVNSDLVISNITRDLADNNSSVPSALDIGVWAYKFGKDLVTSDYDLLEPKYFKEFIVKEKL